MPAPRTGFRILSLLLFASASVASVSVIAQQQQLPAAPRPAEAHAAVLGAATAGGVRFTAPDAVETRAELFSEDGAKLLDSGFVRGGVLDLAVGSGGLPAEGSYLCVLTFREVSGRLRQRSAVVSVRAGEASLRPSARVGLSAAQARAWEMSRGAQALAPLAEGDGEEALTVLSAGEARALAVGVHDGRDAQLTATTGALTFRTGDVFSGEERERMRITPDGQVGVGVDNPQAALDVAGDIRSSGAVRAAGGLEFSDGTTLDASGGRLTLRDASGVTAPAVSAAGTGTQNRLAKWLVTGGAGTLGDSAVIDVGGKLGVGTQTPNFALTLFGNDVGVQLVSPGTGATASDGFRFGIDSGNKAFLWNQEATDLYFGTNKIERMRITDGGNVGVGTNAPAAKLHVNGNVNFAGLRTEVMTESPNVIGGSGSNTVTAGVVGATIGGGGAPMGVNFNANRVTDYYGTVGGGAANTAGDNAGTTIDRLDATVGGGRGNTASGTRSTVGGGYLNQAGGAESTVGGGASNSAGGGRSTAGGGFHNVASGPASTIAGGDNNTASGSYATVGGGGSNSAKDPYSTVPGGALNTAEGEYSFAAGLRARALHNGSFVWSDSTLSGSNYFSSTAPNQFLINAVRVGIGTNDPLARLDVQGSVSVGLTAAPSLPFSAANALFIANDGGAAGGNSFRLDGFLNNLYIVAHSPAGSQGAEDAGIIFRTAEAEGGEADRVVIHPGGTVSVNVLGAAGTTQLCRNASNEIATCAPQLPTPTSPVGASAPAPAPEADVSRQEQQLNRQREQIEEQRRRIEQLEARLAAFERLLTQTAPPGQRPRP